MAICHGAPEFPFMVRTCSKWFGKLNNKNDSKTITCEIHDDTKVKFREKITSLSDAADIVLKDMGYDWASVQGPIWWSYNGKTMSELRREFE